MEREPRGKSLTLAVRWLARVWSVATVGVILAMCFAEMPTNLRDWTGFILYPGGIVVGLILAWWREGLGGGITVGSLVAFYLLHAAITGVFPQGWAWFAFAAPGFLFLWCWRRSRPLAP
jgi:hypothetical protein